MRLLWLALILQLLFAVQSDSQSILQNAGPVKAPGGSPQEELGADTAGKRITKVKLMHQAKVCPRNKVCYFTSSMNVGLKEHTAKDFNAQSEMNVKFKVVPQCGTDPSSNFFKLYLTSVKGNNGVKDRGMTRYPIFFAQQRRTGRIKDVYYSQRDTYAGRKIKHGLVAGLAKRLDPKAIRDKKSQPQIYEIEGEDSNGKFISRHHLARKDDGGSVLTETISYIETSTQLMDQHVKKRFSEKIVTATKHQPMDIARKKVTKTELDKKGRALKMKEASKVTFGGKTQMEENPQLGAMPALGKSTFNIDVKIKRVGHKAGPQCVANKDLWSWEADLETEFGGVLKQDFDHRDTPDEAAQGKDEEIPTHIRTLRAKEMLSHPGLHIANLSPFMRRDNAPLVVGLAWDLYNKHELPMSSLKTVLGALGSLDSHFAHRHLVDTVKDISLPLGIREQAAASLLPRSDSAVVPDWVVAELSESVAHAADDRMATNAALLVGALCDKGPQAACESTLTRVVEELSAGGTTHDRAAVMLHALANAASSANKHWHTVAHFTRCTDARVRAAAEHALELLGPSQDLVVDEAATVFADNADVAEVMDNFNLDLDEGADLGEVAGADLGDFYDGEWVLRSCVTGSESMVKQFQDLQLQVWAKDRSAKSRKAHFADGKICFYMHMFWADWSNKLTIELKGQGKNLLGMKSDKHFKKVFMLPQHNVLPSNSAWIEKESWEGGTLVFDSKSARELDDDVQMDFAPFLFHLEVQGLAVRNEKEVFGTNVEAATLKLTLPGLTNDEAPRIYSASQKVMDGHAKFTLLMYPGDWGRDFELNIHTTEGAAGELYTYKSEFKDTGEAGSPYSSLQAAKGYVWKKFNTELRARTEALSRPPTVRAHDGPWALKVKLMHLGFKGAPVTVAITQTDRPAELGGATIAAFPSETPDSTGNKIVYLLLDGVAWREPIFLKFTFVQNGHTIKHLIPITLDVSNFWNRKPLSYTYSPDKDLGFSLNDKPLAIVMAPFAPRPAKGDGDISAPLAVYLDGFRVPTIDGKPAGSMRLRLSKEPGVKEIFEVADVTRPNLDDKENPAVFVINPQDFDGRAPFSLSLFRDTNFADPATATVLEITYGPEIKKKVVEFEELDNLKMVVCLVSELDTRRKSLVAAREASTKAQVEARRAFEARRLTDFSEYWFSTIALEGGGDKDVTVTCTGKKDSQTVAMSQSKGVWTPPAAVFKWPGNAHDSGVKCKLHPEGSTKPVLHLEFPAKAPVGLVKKVETADLGGVITVRLRVDTRFTLDFKQQRAVFEMKRKAAIWAGLDKFRDARKAQHEEEKRYQTAQSAGARARWNAAWADANKTVPAKDEKVDLDTDNFELGIHVKRGAKLASTDLVKSGDPYVKVRVGDPTDAETTCGPEGEKFTCGHPPEWDRTEVERGAFPEFNTQMNFFMDPTVSPKISFAVYDWDLKVGSVGSDDLIGTGEIGKGEFRVFLSNRDAYIDKYKAQGVEPPEQYKEDIWVELFVLRKTGTVRRGTSKLKSRGFLLVTLTVSPQFQRIRATHLVGNRLNLKSSKDGNFAIDAEYGLGPVVGSNAGLWMQAGLYGRMFGRSYSVLGVSTRVSYGLEGGKYNIGFSLLGKMWSLTNEDGQTPMNQEPLMRNSNAPDCWGMIPRENGAYLRQQEFFEATMFTNDMWEVTFFKADIPVYPTPPIFVGLTLAGGAGFKALQHTQTDCNAPPGALDQASPGFTRTLSILAGAAPFMNIHLIMSASVSVFVARVGIKASFVVFEGDLPLFTEMNTHNYQAHIMGKIGALGGEVSLFGEIGALGMKKDAVKVILKWLSPATTKNLWDYGPKPLAPSIASNLQRLKLFLDDPMSKLTKWGAEAASKFKEGARWTSKDAPPPPPDMPPPPPNKPPPRASRPPPPPPDMPPPPPNKPRPPRASRPPPPPPDMPPPPPNNPPPPRRPPPPPPDMPPPPPNKPPPSPPRAESAEEDVDVSDDAIPKQDEFFLPEASGAKSPVDERVAQTKGSSVRELHGRQVSVTRARGGASSSTKAKQKPEQQSCRITAAATAGVCTTTAIGKCGGLTAKVKCINYKRSGQSVALTYRFLFSTSITARCDSCSAF